MWSDNETERDFLNFETVAAIVDRAVGEHVMLVVLDHSPP